MPYAPMRVCTVQKECKDKVPVWEKLNIPGFTAASDLKNIMSGVAIDGSETESGMRAKPYMFPPEREEFIARTTAEQVSHFWRKVRKP